MMQRRLRTKVSEAIDIVWLIKDEECHHIPGKDFLDLLKKAGFTDAELVAETGINSSPITKGVLIRASKSEVF